MSNKNKITILVIIAALVALPYWRIKSNSQFYVDGLMSHLSHLGTWTHQSVDTSLNGKLTINNLTFTPRGFRQNVKIESVEVHTDMRKLLFSGAQNLSTHLPNSMTLLFNNAHFESNATDLIKAAEKASYWPMNVGYMGAYGCGKGAGPSFTPEQWSQILPIKPQFNMELSYSLVDAYHIDFNLNVDSLNNWYNVWSGTLTRTSDAAKISFNDTIVDTLYYYQVDQGFNAKRNDYCGKENNNSFAAYRLKSAEEIQKHLRVFAGKEMSQALSNQYQRSLAEDVETNVILKLREAKYIYEFAAMPQSEFLAAVDIEVALGENEYQTIALSDIDYLELDMETLRAEMEAKEQEAARKEALANQPKELLKTIVHNIGGTQNEYVVKNWAQSVGQNIKVRTKRGRPIFGKLLAINDSQLTISTRYMRGDATLTVPRKDVVSMTVTR